jgi:predicted transcriptional regulator
MPETLGTVTVKLGQGDVHAIADSILGERVKALDDGNHQLCPRCGGIGVLPTDAFQGKLLREMREAVGLQQRDVAARMGISASYLSDLELGRRQWHTQLVDRYVDAVHPRAH